MVDISEFTADIAPATATHIADYKAAGFVLVPIPSGTKGPTFKGWQKRESCNPPDSWAQNVGLAHAYSGTMALDIDNIEKATPWLTGFGVDLSLLLDDMDAVRIDSGRDNRAKLLYRLPEGVEALPSVKYKDASHDVADFRCGTKGGTTVQDVLPPSIHPDTKKPYTWAGDGSYQHLPDLPPELLKVWQGLLDGSIPNKVNQKPRKKPEATTQKPPATVTPLYRDDTNQDEVEDALQWISPDCPYDDWVNVLMALHSTGAAWAFSSADAFSQRGTKYKSGDVEKKWRSFTHDAGGIGIKTLYQMARAGGWQGYRPHTANSYKAPDSQPEDWGHDTPGGTGGPPDDTQGQQQRKKAEKPPFNLLSVEDLMQNPKPLPWLIKGFIPANSVGQIFGQPEAGKSLLALWLSACIGTGEDWDGIEIKKPGNVIYLAGEGHHGLAQRMKALSIHHNITPGGMYFSEIPAALNIDAEAVAVSRAIDALQLDAIGLIVVDTLHRHMQGNENSAEDFGELLRVLDGFRLKYGCTIMVIHHSGHNEAHRGRGTSALRGAWDFEYSLSLTDQVVVMECTKSKDFQKPLPRNFKIKPVNLPWLDEDGYGIQSVTLEATDEKPARNTRALSGQKLIAFDALVEAVKSDGIAASDEVRAKNENLPLLCRMVRDEVWRDVCYKRGIADNPDGKRQAFNRAKTDLLNMKKIATWDGLFWVSQPDNGNRDIP